MIADQDPMRGTDQGPTGTTGAGLRIEITTQGRVERLPSEMLLGRRKELKPEGMTDRWIGSGERESMREAGRWTGLRPMTEDDLRAWEAGVSVTEKCWWGRGGAKPRSCPALKMKGQSSARLWPNHQGITKSAGRRSTGQSEWLWKVTGLGGPQME